MSYRLTVKPAYLSDFIGLPTAIGRKVTGAVRDLEQNPFEMTKVKKLKGYQGLYRLRLDNYRLIYAVCGRNQVVELLAIGPRAEIYQRFQRQPNLPDQPLPELYQETSAATSQIEEVEVPTSPPSQAPHQGEGLPSFTLQDLQQSHIPPEHHASLLECRTDEDLFSSTVPDEWKSRLLDRLYPKPISMVQAQPNLVLQQAEDLERFALGELTSFLLEMDPEQESLAERSLRGPALVKGGPGSGKSTVALYRVRAILSAEPQARILFTTYTNALTRVSEQLLKQLLGGERPNVLVRTADGLAMQIAGKSLTVAGGDDRRRALRDARHTVGENEDDLEGYLESASIQGLPEDYLLEEFDWVIEGQGIGALEGYLSCDRSGRGVPLDAPLRIRLWELYQAYRKALPASLYSWGEVRLRALERVRQGAYASRYDYVLIDEAQDLTPVALRLCLSLCKDLSGVFLTADAGQSLYNRGFHWNRVDKDLKLTGRTRLLKRNYRSTREIGLAVSSLLRASATGKDPETLEQTFVRQGPRPQVRLFPERQSELSWVAQQIRKAALQLRLSIGSAAVLCVSRALGEEAILGLQKEGIRAEWVTGAHLNLDIPAVKVLTMHSAKGLEFPIVALPFLEDGVLPNEVKPGDEPDLHHQAQRRLLLVAASRAMRRLYLSARRAYSSPYLKDLSPELWDLERETK